MKNSLFLVRKKRKIGEVITSFDDESDQEQPTEEGEALSERNLTDINTEKILIKLAARNKKLTEYGAKIKRLYELAAGRLEEVEKGVLSAFEASPEEVELERWCFETKKSM